MSLFWSRTTLLNFYQNFETHNIPLRRLNIRILIFLDDMFLMSQSIESFLVAKDTLIFLPQHLGLVINLKKSVIEPVQTIEYLGLVIKSIRMALSLADEKVKGILQECKIIFSMKEKTLLLLAQLVGLLHPPYKQFFQLRFNFANYSFNKCQS